MTYIYVCQRCLKPCDVKQIRRHPKSVCCSAPVRERAG